MNWKLALGAATLLYACPAQAEVCDRVDKLTGILKEAGQLPAGYGMQLNNKLLLLYTNGQTGEWTMLSAGRDGVACIVTGGVNWTGIHPLPGQPS